MNEDNVRARVDALLAASNWTDRIARSAGLLQGALSVMTILYGPGSAQAENLAKHAELMRNKHAQNIAADNIRSLAEGALWNIKGELDAGLVGTLQKTITGDVLTDSLQLARKVLDESGDAAKNVAAVLAAGLFEDTIRRIAKSNSIPHIDKLQDVMTELKDKGILQGSQVGIANSYLNFRNSSLHAQWDRVQRESVLSVLAFVEELLRKHFP